MSMHAKYIFLIFSILHMAAFYPHEAIIFPSSSTWKKCIWISDRKPKKFPWAYLLTCFCQEKAWKSHIQTRYFTQCKENRSSGVSKTLPLLMIFNLIVIQTLSTDKVLFEVSWFTWWPSWKRSAQYNSYQSEWGNVTSLKLWHALHFNNTIQNREYNQEKMIA